MFRSAYTGNPRIGQNYILKNRKINPSKMYYVTFTSKIWSLKKSKKVKIHNTDSVTVLHVGMSSNLQENISEYV